MSRNKDALTLMQRSVTTQTNAVVSVTTHMDAIETAITQLGAKHK